MMNTAERRVGRLVEVRSRAGYRTAADVDDLVAAYYAAVGTLPPEQHYVTVVDQRHCPIMAPDAASYLSQRMTEANPRTIRSAALAPLDSPIVMLQFSRVVRDTGYADRRMFSDEGAVLVWLSQVLEPEERERLGEFLAEGAALAAERADVRRSPAPPRR
jgi:hypothetical protein